MPEDGELATEARHASRGVLETHLVRTGEVPLRDREFVVRDPVGHEALDLAAIERDLAAVEAALPRLDDGSYWTDEVTGEPIPDSVLADDPIARRA